MQTVSSVDWAFVRPFLAMMAFTVVFGRFAGLSTEGGAPYPSWFLSACCLGSCFRRSSAKRRTSLVGNVNLVDKIFFPRLIIPAWSAVAALVDLAVNLAIFLRYGTVSGRLGVSHCSQPSWRRQCWQASARHFLITALNVKYRDFRCIILFIVQFGLYVLPDGFSSALVPEQCSFWYSLNPKVGVIDGFSGAYWEAKPGSSLRVCL